MILNLFVIFNVCIRITIPLCSCWEFYMKYRVQDVAELLGMMVEDHKRLQPNVKTYA